MGRTGIRQHVLAISPLIFISIALIRVVASDYFPDEPSYGDSEIWSDFKRNYNKSYGTPEEEEARFHIFIDNHRKIEGHNQEYEAGWKSFRLAVNKYADMTSEEFSSRMNGYRRPLTDVGPRGSIFLKPHNVIIPDEIDWRKQGYVTEIKDQGDCGSCWAFSAVGALEGQQYRKTGELVELSEQNLIDCSMEFGNDGCYGGLMDYAFDYIKANGGIDTEESYPYEAEDDTCRFNKENIGAEDTGYMDIESGVEEDLESALATVGPVSVAIDASLFTFQFYTQGIYDEADCSSSDLDHGVLAVGYGATEAGEKYYIVKNSWGAEWGEEGYIRMSRDKDNQCGIATEASYPLV